MIIVINDTLFNAKNNNIRNNDDDKTFENFHKKKE